MISPKNSSNAIMIQILFELPGIRGNFSHLRREEKKQGIKGTQMIVTFGAKYNCIEVSGNKF